MKKITSFLKNLWKDESGQGMTEYVLLVVVIIAIALIFKEKIKSAVSSKMDEVSSGIQGFNGN